jgi:hypothetical protein
VSAGPYGALVASISHATKYEDELNRRWREMLARVTIDREDANAPKEYLKTVLTAHHACLGEGDTDADEIEASLSTWVQKNYREKLGLKRPDDFFGFLDGLLDLSEYYVRYLQATKRAYFENKLETLFYNGSNGLTGQLAAVLAPIKPREPDSAANAKAALVSNYIDRLYISRVLNDEPLANRDFGAEFRIIIPSLRQCQTPADVIAVLAPRLPMESFDAIRNFRLRGNNRSQVRYFLARLTAYVETGFGKRDESENYLDGSKWHIEHLWSKNQKIRRQDYEEPIEFGLARDRIGALALLPGRDNEAYSDLPFDDKVRLYGRQPNLTAIFSEAHLIRHTVAKGFAAKNEITDLFHNFGPATPIPDVISSRTALYQALAKKVWDPVRIGFPAQLVEYGVGSEQLEHVMSKAVLRPRPKSSPGAALTRLVKAGVVAAGTQLVAEIGGYSATVDEDGIIWLPTGDAFNAVDEAGKAVSGQARCDGLKFWRVQTPEGLLSLRALRDKARANGRLGSSSRR